MLITITVCARDAEDWVEDCLSSLCAQDHRPLQIIAVDDGSNDATLERMQSFLPPKESELELLVRSQGRLGLSAGRNHAVNEAAGEWIAITDIDCRPDSNWISTMLTGLSGLEGEDVVALTGRTVFDSGSSRISRLRSESIAKKYANRDKIVSLANGPCSMFRADILRSIGGFSPDWFHAEDMEVSIRMIQGGGTILYVPEATVQHVAEEGVLRFLKKRYRDARAHFRIVRRYGLRGIKTPERLAMNHDFISDGAIVSLLLPMLGLWSLAVKLLWYGYPPIALLGMFVGIAMFVVPWSRIRILWSIAIWLGVGQGIIDAILGRAGHR